MVYNVHSGECRRSVDADDPMAAACQAMREFQAAGGGMVGRIVSISRHGWPAETGDYADDDHLMATEVLLELLDVAVRQ